MKTQNRPVILIALLYLLIPINMMSQTFAEDSRRTARIFLEIDAHNLFNDPTLDPKQYCTISDNQGNSPSSGSNIQGFTTDVYQGNNVHWWITAGDEDKSMGYSVQLLQIQIKDPNCDIFPKLIIPGNRDDRIFAQVNRSAECKKADYLIWFSVQSPNGKTMVFGLDPWMLVNR